MFAAVVAVLIAFGLLDYLFRGQDAGMRYLVFGGAILLIGLCAWKLFRSVFAARFTDIDVAQFIEGRVTGMGDRLSTTLAFLERAEQSSSAIPANSDSLLMRQAVIEDAQNRLMGVEPSDVLDYRPIRTALIYALVAGIAIGILAGFNASALQTGLSRVLAPWSNVTWPQRNDLFFQNRFDRMTHGSQFVGVVKDRNEKLPESVRFEFQFDSESEIQSREMTELEDSMIIRLENITQSFRYRATGGDDQTKWHHIEVLPAPQLESIVFTVVPPPYTRLPVQTFQDDLKAIAGSQLSIDASTLQEIDDAILHWQIKDKQNRYATSILADGKTIKFPRGDESISISESGVLRLEIIDKQSLSGGLDRPYRVIAVPDLPPLVELNSGGTLGSVTSQATIPLKISAVDDILLKSVSLSYSTNRDATSHVIPLVEPDDSGEHSIHFGEITRSESSLGEEYEVIYPFDLSHAGSLKVGDSIHLKVEAIDAKGQVTSSAKLSLRIATPNELLQNLLELQRLAYEKLLSASQHQEKSIKQLDEVRFSIESNREFPVSSQNSVFVSRRFQKQVVKELADSDQGAIAILNRILSQFKSNSIGREQLVKQIEHVHREIELIVKQPLSRSTFHLDEASQFALEGVTNDNIADLEKVIGIVSENQLEVDKRLKDLISKFSKLDQLRETIKSWMALRQQQDQLMKLTQNLRLETIGKQVGELPDESTRKIAARKIDQNRLSRLAQEASWKLSELVDRSDSTTAEARMIQAAVKISQKLQIDSLMRKTADDIGENRLGNAIGQQEKILNAIEQVLYALQGNRNSQDQNHLEQSRQLESAIGKLATDQLKVTELIKQALTERESGDESKSKQKAAEAKGQQVPISRQLEDLARKVREQNPDTAGRLDRAQESTQATTTELDAGNLERAHEVSQETEQMLKELSAQLHQQINRQQRREDQARNRQAQALLAELIQIQQEAIKRLDGFLQMEEIDQRSAGSVLLAIGKTQWELAEGVGRLKADFKAQIAIDFALGRTIELLKRSATNLDTGKLENLDGTRQLMNDALKILSRIATAIERQAESQAATQADEGTTENEDSQQPQLSPAEIALLLETQQSILDETVNIEKLRNESNGNLSATLKERVDRLAREESALIEIVKLYTKKLSTDERESENGKEIPDVPIPDLPGF